VAMALGVVSLMPSTSFSIDWTLGG
jgi:hypothetical protein